MQKTCSKCGETKAVSEFPKDKRGLHGVRGDCRVCNRAKGSKYKSENRVTVREKNRAAYQENIEQEREKRRRYNEENKGKNRERRKKHRSIYPEKRKAQDAVLVAVRKGIMPKASSCVCRTCEKPATEYHHESYAWADRLKVVPLCSSCHKRVHKGTLVLA